MATVDFDGPKWRLHEMTLTKVSLLYVSRNSKFLG